MSVVFDSHFHLISMQRKDKDATLPLSFVGLEIGLDGGDMGSRIKAVGSDKNIFLSVGAGPWVLDRENFISIDDEIQKLENDIIKFGADAVGEFGFDNHWKYGSPDAQKELFEKEMALAKKYSLATVIHTRDADKELIESIGLIDARTIMHCFSSDREIARKLLDRGAFISFAGNITYKSNSMLQDSAKYVPVDRILYETDAPYLAPIPMRGKVNNPAYTEYTLEFIANLKGVDKEFLKEQVLNNFYRVTGRTESVVKRDILV